MTTELSLNLQQIVVKPGLIEFNEFDRLKDQALDLAHNISQVDVTEENIQTSKKMLAAVNGKLKELESKRISIKKELMQPYETFEQQVKEIVNIVKDADNLVRDQVRTLEECERDEKRKKIADIFEKRLRQYDFDGIFAFEHFLKPNHLNKSTTMKSVEKDMVDWLQKKDSDLNLIRSLPNGEEVLAEYYDTKDISIAINIVREREERKQIILQSNVIKNAVSSRFIIEIADEKDFKLVEMFMKNENIKYKSEKVGN